MLFWNGQKTRSGINKVNLKYKIIRKLTLLKKNQVKEYIKTIIEYFYF